MTRSRSSVPIPLPSACPPAGARRLAWLGIALLLGATAAGLPAHAATDGEADWTGAQQSPADARKEATAALAEGRRECARVKDKAERSDCLKQVEADHAATLKRLAPPKPAARPAPKPTTQR